MKTKAKYGIGDEVMDNVVREAGHIASVEYDDAAGDYSYGIRYGDGGEYVSWEGDGNLELVKRVLDSAKGTTYDRYGHYGEAGVQVETTIELVETVEGFAVQTTMPGGRVIEDPADGEADGREMFSLMSAAGPCPEDAK